MTRSANGTTYQSGLLSNPLDYTHERLYYPIVGVILAVHLSDNPVNASAISISDQRGSQVTCDVLAVSHGNDNPWFIPNVVVLPSGPTGVDDFCEDIPRPCSQLIDGSKFDSQLGIIDYEKLDGDWAVVGFIGGSIEHPIMLKWWPHPGNKQDPATGGFDVRNPDTGTQPSNTLQQGRRSFKRYAGTKFTVTSKGSVFIDTNESNAEFSGSKSGIQRKARDEGGDVQVDIKKSRQVQVNFNPPVPLGTKEPSTPQPNPPEADKQRDTDRTTVTLDKDTIKLLAGKIVQLLTTDENIEIHAKTKVTAVGDDGNDSVLLGDTNTGNMDHAVNGETFLQQRFDTLVNFFNAHTHPTSVGPTDKPTVMAQLHQSADLSSAVKVKR